MPHGKALNAREETQSPHFPLIPSRSPTAPTRYFLTRAYSLGWTTLLCLLACVRAQDMTHLGFEEFQVGTLPPVVTHFTVFEPCISNDGAFEGQQYLAAYGAISIDTPNHDLVAERKGLAGVIEADVKGSSRRTEGSLKCLPGAIASAFKFRNGRI